MLRKTISVLLTLIILFGIFDIFPSSAFAATSGTTGDCTWNLDDTVLTISGNGNMGDYGYNNTQRAPWGADITEVIIIDGVKSIGNYAFYDCTDLTSVTISNSVKSIGNSSFVGCTGLTNIIIPNAVNTIGDDAFYGCTGLKSITLGNSVTSIGEFAFDNCSSLTHLMIPDSVTSIGSNAFKGCTGLTNVSMGSSLRSINSYTFFGCSRLANIVLPDSVKSIGDSAFYGCTALNSVAIGKSMNSIEYQAFYGCKNISNVFYGGSQNEWSLILIYPSNIPLTSATIHYGVDGASNNQNESLNRFRITVYQNNILGYTAAKDAVVSYQGEHYLVGEDGIAVLPKLEGDMVTVTKNGYISRVLTIEQLQESSKVFLERKSSNKPVIYAAWIGNTDILHSTYSLSMVDKDPITIKAEVDWGNYQRQSLRLFQNGRSLEFSGDTLTTVISDTFDTSDTIKLIATDSAGRTDEREVKIENSTVNKVMSSLDGAEFDFDDKIKFTLPDNIEPSWLAGMSVGAGISTALPITVCADDGKIYVAIGVELIDHENSQSTTSSTNSSAKIHRIKKDTKSFIKQLKDTGVFKTKDMSKNIQRLKNLKSTFKNAIRYPKGKFGLEADFSILGFAEGTFGADGNITWLDSGVILNPSIMIKKDFPFSIGPVPMYFATSFSAEALAQMNFIFNEQAKNFIPAGEISGDIKVSGGVGVGISGVLYAEGGLEGKLSPDFKLYYNYDPFFKMDFGVNAYAKAGILCFEGKKTWDIFNITLVETGKDRIASTGTDSGFSFYDTGTYSVKDLSYLDKDSRFTANNPFERELAATGSNNSNVNISTIKTNIYRESTPKIVSLGDDKRIAFWLDSKSSDANLVQLYYSVYNGSSWSVPEVVLNDGTMDYAPTVSVIDGTAYVAWQNATKRFENIESLTLDDIAGDFDITVACYNGETFTDYTIENDGLDMQPVLCDSDDGNVNLAWVNNSENHWFSENNTNSIMTSTFTGNDWTEPQYEYTGLNLIYGLDIDDNNGLQIAYCEDTDGDLTTTEDMRIFENGVLLNGDDICASSPKYLAHKLYWFSNNNILNSDMKHNEGKITTNNYQLIETNGTVAALFTEGDGLKSTLYISYYNTATKEWGTPQILVNNESFIGAFAVNPYSDSLEVLLNSMLVSGDTSSDNPYGTASLLLCTATEDVCDLSIDEIYYDKTAYCAGSNMDFTVEISNKGNQVIKGATIEVVDSDHTILSSYKTDETIIPGDKIIAEVNCIPRNADIKNEIRFSVTPNDHEDTLFENNTKALELSFESIAVENITQSISEDGKAFLAADIINHGYKNAKDIKVSLYKDSLDCENNALDYKMVDTLDSHDVKTVVFEIDGSVNNTYYISLDEEIDEYTSDNYDFILVQTAESNEKLLGDVDGDGEVRITDATYIMRKVAQIEIPFEMNDAIADVDGDGEVTLMDATYIQRWLANLQSNDNIGKLLSAV